MLALLVYINNHKDCLSLKAGFLLLMKLLYFSETICVTLKKK